MGGSKIMNIIKSDLNKNKGVEINNLSQYNLGQVRPLKMKNGNFVLPSSFILPDAFREKNKSSS